MLKITNPFLLVFIVALILGGIWYFGSLKTPTSSVSTSVLDSTDPNLAPDLSGIAGYINSNSSLSISSLRGRVVLVDFWTYSCINCIRTIPYLTAWDEKYRDDGLVIIGVHAPEFEFEKDYSNVKRAVEKFGIKFPVVLDNSFSTWQSYANHYWPHKYLIDKSGHIRYDHIGEGNYEETEQMIQTLLSENYSGSIDRTLASSSIVSANDLSQIRTPEIYLGYGFARASLGNSEGFSPNKIVNYSISDNQNFALNRVYLDGEWLNSNDYMELKSQTGKVVLRFKAKNLNIVAGGNATLDLSLDNSPALNSLGSDAKMAGSNSVATIDSQRLYSLIDSSDYSEKVLEITVHGEGFRIYTYTFG